MRLKKLKCTCITYSLCYAGVVGLNWVCCRNCGFICLRCLEEMYNNEREIIWNMLPRSVQIQVVACCRSVIFSADLGTEKPENSNFEIQTWQTLSRTLLIFENLVKPEPEVCSKLEPELGCLSGPRQHYCYWENLFLLVWCI